MCVRRIFFVVSSRVKVPRPCLIAYYDNVLLSRSIVTQWIRILRFHAYFLRVRNSLPERCCSWQALSRVRDDISNRKLHVLLRKNVSCASRAGWDWGWNSASKFQKLLSTKRLVGISSNLSNVNSDDALRFCIYPISIKTRRNSVRTFIRGCKWPPPTGKPIVLKLYGLKLSCSHVFLYQG